MDERISNDEPEPAAARRPWETPVLRTIEIEGGTEQKLLQANEVTTLGIAFGPLVAGPRCRSGQVPERS